MAWVSQATRANSNQHDHEACFSDPAPISRIFAKNHLVNAVDIPLKIKIMQIILIFIN